MLQCSTMDQASASGEQQVFVRSLGGRSISVDADLDGDVTALALRLERIEPSATCTSSLRFVFSGRQLQVGFPLHQYGVVKGSNIHVTSVLLSSLVKGRMTFPIEISTPFAEVSGTLEWKVSADLPPPMLAQHLDCCELSTTVMSSLDQESERLGVWKAGPNVSWTLNLGELNEFPCLQPFGFEDLWDRLAEVPIQIDVWECHPSPDDSCDRKPLASLMSEEDTLNLATKDAPEVKLCVSLFTDIEQMVDEATLQYQESVNSSSDDHVCCICLEPMLPCQVLRRLPCFHSLHAGCAMRFLTKKRRCPLCRTRLFEPRTASCDDAGATEEDEYADNIESSDEGEEEYEDEYEDEDADEEEEGEAATLNHAEDIEDTGTLREESHSPRRSPMAHATPATPTRMIAQEPATPVAGSTRGMGSILANARCPPRISNAVLGAAGHVDGGRAAALFGGLFASSRCPTSRTCPPAPQQTNPLARWPPGVWRTLEAREGLPVGVIVAPTDDSIVLGDRALVKLPSGAMIAAGFSPRERPRSPSPEIQSDSSPLIGHPRTLSDDSSPKVELLDAFGMPVRNTWAGMGHL